MKYFLIFFTFTLIAVISIAGFRGTKTEKTPLYIFPDMDRQQKFHPQGENQFYGNRMDDRMPVGGTVVRGTGLNQVAVFSGEYENVVIERPELLTGKDANGDEISEFPLPVTYELMELGRQKYDIFCTVCHGGLGEGNGVTLNYGINASNLTTDIYRQRPDGNIYNTITYGYNTMMGYGDKLTVEERWAVVLYVRALQKVFSATEAELTPEQKRELGL